jgi:hypothetical protein
MDLKRALLAQWHYIQADDIISFMYLLKFATLFVATGTPHSLWQQERTRIMHVHIRLQKREFLFSLLDVVDHDFRSYRGSLYHAYFDYVQRAIILA